MKTFQEFINENYLSALSRDSRDLCGPTSIRAFGICVPDGNKVMKQHEIVNELKKSGYRVENLPKYPFRGYTVGRFMNEFPSGSYLLFTSKHAMAYIDGILTDTNHTKRALSKKLVGVFKVER